MLQFFPMTQRRPSARALTGVAVLTAWAGSLLWLGIRTTGQSESITLSNEASLRLSPVAAWFAIYSGSEQVGSAGITLDTLSPGYRVRETVTLELPSGPASLRATRLTESRLSATLSLRDARSVFSLGNQRAEWSLIPSGDSLTLGYDVGDHHITARIATPANALTIGAMPYRLALTGGLAAGRTRRFLLMAGSPPAARQSTLRVGRDSMVHFADSSSVDRATNDFLAAHRDSVRATEVILDSPVGPYSLWIDQRGGIAGLGWPLGVRWVRTDFDIAVQAFRRTAEMRRGAIVVALGALAPLAGPGGVTDTATHEVRYRIERRDGHPISGGMVVYLSGGRQSIQTGVLRVQPVPERGPRGNIDDRPYDPLAQSDAPAILALAKEYVGTGPDVEGLTRLAAAIPRLARVDTSASAAIDAVGTFAAHRGRPDGLARLFVAVAEAAGFRARYVVGVLPRGDSLLTHAWAEVYDPAVGAWTAVDPVFGRVHAGAGLIRLGYAGTSHPEELRPMIAQAKFTLLTAMEAP